MAIGALVIVFTAIPAFPASACSQGDALAGACPSVNGSISGDAAVLNGSQPGASGSGNNGTTGSNGSTTPPPIDPACAVGQIRESCERNQFTVTSLPVPTLNDIAAFRPTPGIDHMEPNGWFVVGLDANFYATGGTSVVDGTLLGYDASVRFTPIRWQWTYGDGSSATKSTRGGTWASQGIPEFDATPTSHVYEAAGTYYIDLTIGYRAEYSFNGAGWLPIAGTLWLPANRLVATVGSAKTVLVERDCTINPAGPGCSN